MAKSKKSGEDGADTIQSYDSSEILTDIGFYKTLFRLYWDSRKICIPAIVKELHDDEGLLTVKPLVNASKTTMKGRVGIERADVKVWPIQFAHGGYRFHCPIYVGDTGYLVSGDRFAQDAIEKNNQLVKESVEKYEDSPNKGPQDLTVFDTNEWEYGFFIPSSWVNEKDLPDELKGKLSLANIQEGDKSAYITIDQEGEVVIHGAKVEIEAEETSVKGDFGVEGDTSLDGDVSVTGDADIGGDLAVDGDTTLRGDLSVEGDTSLKGELSVEGDTHIGGSVNIEGELNITPSEGEQTATMIDTVYVTGVQGNNLTTWRGKIMRTEGGAGDPIPIPGGGGGGGDMKADNVSLAIENEEMSIKGYKSKDSSGSLANAMFGGDAVTGDVMVRPGKSSDPSFTDVGTVTPGEGVEFATGQNGPEIKLALEDGGGIKIESGSQGKKKISSSCVSEVSAYSAVTTNPGSTSLRLTATPTSKPDGTTRIGLMLDGNIAPGGGGGGIQTISITSDAVTGQGAENDAPATKISYSVDGGEQKDVTLIPSDAVTGPVLFCVGVEYNESTKKLVYKNRQMNFKNGVLMSVSAPSDPNDAEVEVFEAVDHVPEEP